MRSGVKSSMERRLTLLQGLQDRGAVMQVFAWKFVASDDDQGVSYAIVQTDLPSESVLSRSSSLPVEALCSISDQVMFSG